MHWVFLSIAIVSEVMATSAMKASVGFTKPIPSVITAGCFAVSLYFLSLTLKALPVGIAYAIWAGAGIVLISIIGLVVFKQSLDAAAIIGIALIVSGVAVINTLSTSVSH